MRFFPQASGRVKLLKTDFARTQTEMASEINLKTLSRLIIRNATIVWPHSQSVCAQMIHLPNESSSSPRQPQNGAVEKL
jgi:hypothetical protein